MTRVLGKSRKQKPFFRLFFHHKIWTKPFTSGKFNGMSESIEVLPEPKPLTHRQRKFLAVFSMCGNIAQSCRQLRIGRVMPFDWQKKNPVFKKAFQQAREEAADRLEEEARRRAVDGVTEPVFYLGQQVGEIRKFSDGLLVKLMAAARPGKFRDRQVNHFGDIHHKHAHVHGQVKQQDSLDDLSPEALEQIIAIVETDRAKKMLPKPENSDEQQKTSAG